MGGIVCKANLGLLPDGDHPPGTSPLGFLQNRRGHRCRHWLCEILNHSFLAVKEDFIGGTAAGAHTRLELYGEVPVALWCKLASGSRGVRAK